jgi:signal transduction histidine kinase
MSRRAESKRSARALRTAWWRDLGLWARFSIAGIAVAAALALALGWFIPNWVGDRFLETQARADQTVLTALTETEALVVSDAPNFEALDDFVTSALLRGDFVRVKLWAPDGLILYSDEPELIGMRFEPDEDFEGMFEPQSHVSDLSAEENEFESDQFEAGLLETYVPVRSADNELVAVWEVYHSLEEHDAAVAETRRTVRLTVAAGLALLAIFLVSVFGGLIASVQRRRREAESRSADLATVLNIVRSTAQTLDRDEIIDETVRQLYASSAFEWLTLTHSDETGHSSVLAAAGMSADCAPGGSGLTLDCAPVEATAVVETGSLILVGCVHSPEDYHAAEALLQASIEELGVSTHRADLYEDLETSRARLQDVMQRLVTAQESERQRIVGEIHDGLGQDIHRVLFGIRGCLSGDQSEIEAELQKLEELVSGSSARLRRLLQELHPSMINDIGLAASLRSLADRMRTEWGLQVELHQADFAEPAEATRMAIFRIAQEALMNIVKHAGTCAARVSVITDEGFIRLEIEDGGTGISGQRGDGLGMWLMQERAEVLGGTFEVLSVPGSTVIRARLPLEEGS